MRKAIRKLQSKIDIRANTIQLAESWIDAKPYHRLSDTAKALWLRTQDSHVRGISILRSIQTLEKSEIAELIKKDRNPKKVGKKHGMNDERYSDWVFRSKWWDSL